MSTKRFFISVARLSRRLPNFRGKVRLLLTLYRVLGLENQRVDIETRLYRPLPYTARLNLGCAHERMAFLMGGYEWDATVFLSRLYDRTGYFLDVGANVGLIALPFAAITAGQGGAAPASSLEPHVYCLEPVHSNFEALQAGIALNEFEELVEAICVAVGEVEKDAEIQIEGNLRHGGGTGTANLLPSDSSFDCERLPQHVTTIDHLVDSGQLPSQCCLIKLDTDGYDLYVLQGATKLLESSRPIVFGEFMAHCLAWHGQSIGDVAAIATALDYRVLVRQSPAWSFAPHTDSVDFSQDALLVPAEKLAQLAWCCS